MRDVFQNGKCKEFEMQTVQQSNWYHRGDRDQRSAVLMEKSHSLFVRCRVNGHKATVKSSKRWSSAEASSAAAQKKAGFVWFGSVFLNQATVQETYAEVFTRVVTALWL